MAGPTREPPAESGTKAAIQGIGLILGLLLLPLGISMAEGFFLGSHHFVEWMSRVGLFEFFARVYAPLSWHFRRRWHLD